MSLYYSSKIGYLLEDISDSNFDFRDFIKAFKQELAKEKEDLHITTQKVKVQLEIKSPDFELIHRLYQEGVIKSHETEATIDKTKDMIKYAISNVMQKLHLTVEKYLAFRDTVKVQRLEYLVKNSYAHDSDRMDIISMEFNLRVLEISDIIAFIKVWTLEEFTFAKEINAKVFTQKKGTEEFENLLEYGLERKPNSELTDFLRVEDQEYLKHPKYFEILKAYMFPAKFHGNAEITLDVAKEDKAPSKRRTVSLQDTKMKFHQLLSENTPYEKYRQIIEENDIAGVYLSVRSTNNEILYLLIDIDIPSLLSNMFSRQLIWEFTVNIATEINNIAKRLGLPSFKKIFSGARGIHLVYAMDYDTITDIEHHVNLPELADGTLLPGITSLKKEKISSLNDKFKFAKSLLQSLLLYTVYKGNIIVPPEIRRKLKIAHAHQLFRLAVDSKDLISVLLDTSSVSKGVFRLFSPHPVSRMVSIPLSEGEENEIDEKYHTYKNVLQDAKIDAVLQRFDKDDIELFLELPPKITRDHIQELLRPDKLYPSFATLLRFGTTYCMKRTPSSFAFWHRFYELRGAYNYIYTKVLTNTTPENIQLFRDLKTIISKLQVQNGDHIVDILRLHLLTDVVSFPVFNNCLTTLYYDEFFFSMKSPAFIQENEHYLVELFKNQWEFSNFLTQTEHMYSIAVNVIIDVMVMKEKENLFPSQKKCLEQLEAETTALLDITRHSMGELRWDLDTMNKEEKLVNTMYFVSAMYFTIVRFLKEFKNSDGRE